MSADLTSSLSRAELDAYWMPYTGNRDFKDHPRMIVGADGCHYFSADGRKVLDGLSGLWCCGMGHNRREIAIAVTDQIARLDYAPAFQFGHPLAFELANRIKAMTPGDLDYVFFSNSGSEATETALKMARAYWFKRGEPERTKLIGRGMGYHGVNFGGTSVGGIEPNRAPYGDLIDTAHLPHTLLPENAFSRGLPEHGVELADELEVIVDEYGAGTIAAVIVEPFSGSAGVILPPRGYLQRLREICTRHGILLIFDEVITGFGRTGANFGADAFGVVPDIMCFAKTLTNGCVPMGATVAKAEIYETFMATGGPDYAIEFLHGYTYSAHPVACAAALAALDIFEDEKLADRCAALAPYLEDAVHALTGLPHVVDIRNFGLVAGIQLEPYPDEPARRPYEVGVACWEKGLYVRFAGNALALAPHFIAEKEHIDFA
ncbi:MAG TPA: aspartate aminotransferase family protein, partial [Gammaproteobacteria bacterium]